MDYPDFTQSTTGLWCCHAGPPGCTCDIVQYAQAVKDDGSAVGCIASDDEGTITVAEECDGDSWALGTWRETTYTADVKQVEIYNHTNVFLCLGVDGATDSAGCQEGAAISLVDCGGIDDTASRISWDEANSQMVSDSCPGMCVGATEVGGQALLQPCAEASSWNRVYLD